jgi:hypothetical protein
MGDELLAMSTAQAVRALAREQIQWRSEAQPNDCFDGKYMTSINPGPKPKRQDGKDDRRHHVDPPTAPKHPTLPIHKTPKKK